jgi:hypothetical protein
MEKGKKISTKEKALLEFKNKAFPIELSTAVKI